MTAYRTGYGTGLYGVRAYGLDGSILPVSTTATTQASVSCSVARIRPASATANALSAASAIVATVQTTGATVQINAILTANARLFWEPEVETPEVWTAVPPASATWMDASSASEIWTEVA